jgi:Fe-S-cluster-containing hydrogenase component 2
MRLYTNNSRCSGCRACLVACSLNLFGENNPKKAAMRVIPHFPAPGIFELKVCTQCGACADVCPTGAIKQNTQGAYFVDYAECNLCEACVPACPEEVMFVRVELSDHSWKCDLCGDCALVCGTDALWVGSIESAGMSPV